MPARHSTVAKPKKLKGKVPIVVISRPKKELRKKPEVLVNETSTPEEILHASWEFISAYQFFNTFKSYFKLPNSLSIETLEAALLGDKNKEPQEPEMDDDNAVHLRRESSVLSQQSNQSGSPQPTRNYLANFMVHILSPLLTLRQKSLINQENYPELIAAVFPEYTNFLEMSILDKIKVLKSIELAHIDVGDPDLIALQADKSSQALRITPLGTDCEGWVYWYFGDTRLYREIPLPRGKKAGSIFDTLRFTFELVCSTADEWTETIKKLQSVKRTGNREISAMVAAVGSEVILTLEAREEARLKLEQKLKKCRELQLMPKKRSRRLEVKHDEQSKRRKLLDEAKEKAKEKANLEELERQRLEAQKMEDEENYFMYTAESKLKKDFSTFFRDLMLQGQTTEADMKTLRTQPTIKTTEADRILKMKAWGRFLKGSISVELARDGSVRFLGLPVKTALKHILFKNMIRIYLLTLLLFRLNPLSAAYEIMDDMHINLLLDRYQTFDAFNLELNMAFSSITDVYVRNDVVQLLIDIFSSQPPTAEEIKQQQEQQQQTEQAQEQDASPTPMQEIQVQEFTPSQVDQVVQIESSVSQVENYQEPGPSQTEEIKQQEPVTSQTEEAQEQDAKATKSDDSSADAVPENTTTTNLSPQSSTEITLETTAATTTLAIQQTPSNGITTVDPHITTDKPMLDDEAVVQPSEESAVCLDSANVTDSLQILTDNSSKASADLQTLDSTLPTPAASVSELASLSTVENI